MSFGAAIGLNHMTSTNEPTPTTELDADFSPSEATPTDWARTRRELETAEVSWLTTVRPDGRPHVTPLITVWADGAAHFCTGPDERKAKNLAHNGQCVLTTGTNTFGGIDVVLDGEATNVADDATLRRLAEGWEAKYGSEWHFDVENGAFGHEGGTALVFRVAPRKVFAYEKDAPGAATRYRF